MGRRYDGGYGPTREGKEFDSRDGNGGKNGFTDSYDSESLMGEDGVVGHDAAGPIGATVSKSLRKCDRSGPESGDVLPVRMRAKDTAHVALTVVGEAKAGAKRVGGSEDGKKVGRGGLGVDEIEGKWSGNCCCRRCGCWLSRR